ncbi:MAG: hypothetical protein IJV44_02800 [Prevotella sp.]|nr:hypothetical protein [Prevotella sp.]
MKQIFDSIIRDISSFVEYEVDVIPDKKGHIVFEKGGTLYELEVLPQGDDGSIKVKYLGEVMSYRTFLSKHLAHLDQLASKILQKNKDLGEHFVDAKANLIEADETTLNGLGLQLIEKECLEESYIGTKLSFVTADAGHGKSMLLHHFQTLQARKYLEGKSKFLFWHIDLNGRDLVRLNEAIMFELNELRFGGLYYSSILTLIRHKLIVLGIDGFDELLAEMGGEMALSSITHLLEQMEGRGVIVAASRRTFFNSQDYAKRVGLLKSQTCEFNELRICNWEKEQCVQYLDTYAYEKDEYEKLLEVLKDTKHPILERPYLFTKLVGMSFDAGESPASFITSGDSNLDGMDGVIESFVKREVKKWHNYDKETGTPYLTLEQHIELLSNIALEMWNDQRNTMSIEMIQIIVSILLEKWSIEVSRKPKITEMVKAHALLVNVDGKNSLRKFDHDEFRHYFLARALCDLMKKCIEEKSSQSFRNVFSKAQMPDAVALFVTSHLNETKRLIAAKLMQQLGAEEWKATYLQQNIGTFLPFLLDGIRPQETLEVGPKYVFSSMALSDKIIVNIIFNQCNFINVTLSNTSIRNCRFVNCTFTNLRIIVDGNHFENVLIEESCSIDKLTLIRAEGMDEVEYVPEYILAMLRSIGIKTCEKEKQNDGLLHEEVANQEFYKSVKRLLNKFNQSPCIYEKNIQESHKYGFKNPDMVLNDILPLMVKHQVIESREGQRAKQAGTVCWYLKAQSVDEIFMGEVLSQSRYAAFWQEVRHHQ